MRDKYYDYILHYKPSIQFTKEERIVFELISDMTDRRGFRNQWENVDKDVKEEWFTFWIDKVRSIL